ARTLRLPDFIAVGPVRTGTTWLDSIFRGHVGLPARIKETQFFGWRYELGIDWYARHFQACREPVVGEFAPTYFYDAGARARIIEQIPRCKIICTLREPVARIYSHYQLWRKLAIVKGTFAEELERNPQLLARIHYTPHVRAWQERFGRENLLVLIYEDSRHERQGYIDRICGFIGVPSLNLETTAGDRRMLAHFERAPRSRQLARRARQLKDALEVRGWLRTLNRIEPLLEACMSGGAPFPPLDAELAMRLRARCAPDLAELGKLLGRDLSIWRAP
ncbi:MAG: sulfotransferase domain-containing protein, partial [Candidatus Binataceae bacterium]